MDPRRREEIAMLGNWDIPPDMVDYVATEHQRAELLKIMQELEKRKIEALRLYEPSPFQDQFHRCTAKEAALQKGNQAGGTLCGAVELARAVTGQDPYDKYTKNDGVAVTVGFKEDHIGTVIYRYLFMPGAFRIIRNGDDWRVFRPWQDKGREKEAKPAPPLIPDRFIKEFVWMKRGQRIFSRVDFTTGWEFRAYSSRANPAQGFCANLIWIDEDLERDEWYTEMIARLSMSKEKTGYKGVSRWTALPHSKNDALVNLIERAEDQANEAEPESVVIRASIFDNPYMDDATKRENVRIWQSLGDDEYRKRALGELTTDSVLMYPEFSEHVHKAMREPPKDDVDLRPAPCAVLWENGGQPPQNWCRYLAVDPGHQVCAVAFIAIPPPTLGDFAVMYDELYIRQCDARKFAEHVAHKARDQQFQRFVIDLHGGNLRDLASGQMPHEQYAERLRDLDIKSIETKHRFQAGCSDITARTLKLHEWLHIRRDGTPKFLVVSKRCPNLMTEFRRFKKKIVQNVITDQPNIRTPCHLIQAVEYLAAADLKYVKPKDSTRKTTVFDRIMGARKERDRHSKHRNFRPGATTVSLGPNGA